MSMKIDEAFAPWADERYGFFFGADRRESAPDSQAWRISSARGESSGQARESTTAPTSCAMASIERARASRLAAALVALVAPLAPLAPCLLTMLISSRSMPSAKA